MLLAKIARFESYSFPKIRNPEIIDLFRSVHSIEFYMDIVAFKIDSAIDRQPEMIWNRPATTNASDFRYRGAASADVSWPDPFRRLTARVRGGGSPS